MLYKKQQVRGGGGNSPVFTLSLLLKAPQTRVQAPLWLVPLSRAVQMSFAGTVCSAAFRTPGKQQLPQPINCTGLKIKSPASTPGLLTP